MKKIILCSLITLMSSVAFSGEREKLMDCTVYKVYDTNVFEEGLSADEYPDLWVYAVNGGYDVNFGAAGYESADGDKITYNPSEDYTSNGNVQSATLTVTSASGNATYVLKHETTYEENSALLLKRYKGEENFSRVAKFVCTMVFGED